MARKQDLIDLQSQVDNLTHIIEQRDREITNLIKYNGDLSDKLNVLQNSNNHLTDALDRTNNSRRINEEINHDLIHAIASLGKELRERNEAKAYHLCNPQVSFVMQAAENQVNKQ